MARVIFSSDLQQFTGGVGQADVSACSFRELRAELCQRFPALTDKTIDKYALAIDGVIIQKPMLETFRPDSELVFIARIAGG